MRRGWKKELALVMVTAMSLSLVACGQTNKTEETKVSTETVKATETATEAVKATETAGKEAPKADGQKTMEGKRIIHLISNTRGDGGNHDMAASAVEKMAAEYGAEIKIVEMGNTSADTAKYLPTTLDACEDGWDYIVCGSAQMVEPVMEASKEYPDQKFIVYDAEVVREKDGDFPNVYSALFKQNESSYLVGAMAMLMSDSATIGFIGGQEIPVINDFLVGYTAGARSVNEKAVVLNSFIGSWNDLAKAKELASIQYQQGASLIFPAAGQAYAGIYEAGFEQKKMYLGCDVDRTKAYEATNPDMNTYMPTSVIKYVDQLVENTFVRIMNGEEVFGKHESVGLKENCVGIVENKYYTQLVSEDIRKQVEEIKDKIVSGEIQVPSAFGMTQAELNEYKKANK